MEALNRFCYGLKYLRYLLKFSEVKKGASILERCSKVIILQLGKLILLSLRYILSAKISSLIGFFMFTTLNIMQYFNGNVAQNRNFYKVESL